MAKTPKRPRDLNQWAKRMVDIATGETGDDVPTADTDVNELQFSHYGKLGAASGGKARANALSPERRTEIARIAAAKRWSKS